MCAAFNNIFVTIMMKKKFRNNIFDSSKKIIEKIISLIKNNILSPYLKKNNDILAEVPINASLKNSKFEKCSKFSTSISLVVSITISSRASKA